MPIYRAVSKLDPHGYDAASSLRPPGNVPYLVDNLWEWARPKHLASRRVSAFASPLVELAAASANLNTADVYQVSVEAGRLACQIVRPEGISDAKFHPDVQHLRRLVIKSLPREWFALRAQDRADTAPLFLPCASRSDVEAALNGSQYFNLDEIQDAVTLWKDVQIFDMSAEPIDATGEIFFEGHYQLTKRA
jgi:hypothetical protein